MCQEIEIKPQLVVVFVCVECTFSQNFNYMLHQKQSTSFITEHIFQKSIHSIVLRANQVKIMQINEVYHEEKLTFFDSYIFTNELVWNFFCFVFDFVFFCFARSLHLILFNVFSSDFFSAVLVALVITYNYVIVNIVLWKLNVLHNA